MGALWEVQSQRAQPGDKRVERKRERRALRLLQRHPLPKERKCRDFMEETITIHIGKHT